MRKEFRDLASTEEAARVADDLTPQRSVERVDLVGARGRTLAEDVKASVDVPGFDRSLMDGYAVRAEDTYGAGEAEPATLTVVGSVSAGEPPEVEVGEAEAAEIATGAPIPEGADAVVPVERTETDGNTVDVRKAVAPADSVMFAGSDVASGEVALRAGTTLSQREIGLAAAVGSETLPVYASPRVGVVSTGDELVRPGGALGEGQIHDVNTFSVAASVEDAGGEAVVYDHVGDDYEAMVDTMREASSDCDIVLSSGSTSASDEDVVYRVIEQEGELLLHGVALKPGRPTVFGKLDGTPFVGLPGNPISALSVFRVFVEGMLRDAAGGGEDERLRRSARVADEVRVEGGRTRLLPVGLVEDGDGTTLAYSVDKGSGATTSLTRADGIVNVEPSTNYIDEGELVEVELFGGATPPALLGAGERDGFLDSALKQHKDDVRWLPTGSVAGAQRLRDGVADVAAIGLSQEALDALGVDEAVRIRGYDRRVGYVGDPEGDVFGVLPDGYALRELFDERNPESETRVFRSERGAANAVASGKVDSAFVGEDVALDLDAGFEPSGWSSVDILVAEDRRDKDGVVAFLNSLRGAEEPDGYRVPDEAGEPLRG
ncbi:molybdopterin biosynthesis protein [Haladaptatus sp. F3-133]|jgi:molybdenum cofactor synthesis domain-containing protein|uniref:Molybdopterin biosynthesis protein n=1 Tax=Halorutilus salinus TaxID=2487751 RepID=A0A9Q4C5J2_9EURY|nr:molybdopterin biosynthesis protein [Halorutilus salinus]MCX2819467.1 molybdopterin biosynthesis protein [Halorutilus salinus]